MFKRKKMIGYISVAVVGFALGWIACEVRIYRQGGKAC